MDDLYLHFSGLSNVRDLSLGLRSILLRRESSMNKMSEKRRKGEVGDSGFGRRAGPSKVIAYTYIIDSM